ncbi:polysaccharide deacetylase family protein [Oceanobacillus manasiensis]|uniref:polysaccharide deacetylase family protein n=1 Tax=Oceanobacillus manasiensis TaxID=586413 RepID=UPI0005AB654F|nr:polysaccharide deacetylase family protein [Oceanobacillus manasiensis]
MDQLRKITHIIVFLIIVGISFNTSYNPFSMESSTTFMPTAKTNETLYKEIEEQAKEYKEEPVDPYIDEVWKKTPGRNGVEVDVTKSYEKMKKEGEFDESMLVFKQISPSVSLDDLPPSPIYRGNPEKKMVSLLINVSWGTEYVPKLLAILKDKQVKATFFIEGKWAKENVELVKMIKNQNHLIGNHAYNHPDMARLTNQQMVEQINQTNDILKAITGDKPAWFAPPSGSYNQYVVDAAHNFKMETVLWTTDTIDWKNPTVSVMIDRVNSKLHPGATILMHPTASTADGLDELIDSVKDKGYKIGTVEQLVSPER